MVCCCFVTVLLNCVAVLLNFVAVLLCYSVSVLLWCAGEPNLSSAKGLNTGKLLQPLSQQIGKSLKCVLQWKTQITNVFFNAKQKTQMFYLKDRQAGMRATRSRAIWKSQNCVSQYKIQIYPNFVLQNMNVSQLVNYKTKLCPNFEIQKATRRAEQSLITLISNTCATPHSFQRVSNYFCKTLVVLL